MDDHQIIYINRKSFFNIKSILTIMSRTIKIFGNYRLKFVYNQTCCLVIYFFIIIVYYTVLQLFKHLLIPKELPIVLVHLVIIPIIRLFQTLLFLQLFY